MAFTFNLQAEYYSYGFQASYRPVLPEKYNTAKGAEFTIDGRERYRPDLGNLNGQSVFGLPLWMPTGFMIEGELNQLPNEPIITLNTQNIIKTTQLAGNDSPGAVHENIAAGDWMIKIEGICIDPFKKAFPEDQVELVNYIREQKVPIAMKNYLTELNGIDQVIVSSFKWKKLHGTPFSIGYAMTLISDYEFELIIE